MSASPAASGSEKLGVRDSPKAVRVYVLCSLVFLGALDWWAYTRRSARPPPERPTPIARPDNAEANAVIERVWQAGVERWQQRMLRWEARKARARGHLYAVLLTIPALLLLLATWFARRPWPWSTLALLLATWGAVWPVEMLITWLTRETLETSLLLNFLHSLQSLSVVRLLMAWVLFQGVRREIWKQEQPPVAGVFD